MKKYISNILILVLLLNFSCQSFLEEDPKGQVAVSNFYNSVGEVTQALIGAYAQARPLYTATSLCFASDMASDELSYANGAGGSSLSVYDSFKFNASDISLINTYKYSYQLINSVNTLLENLKAKQLTGDKTKVPIIEGEALFLRALAYYNLVMFYGDVPLRTEATSSVNGLLLPRTPANKVYDLILADLKTATNQLTETGEGSGRANKLAALVLLARVQLSLGQNSDAVNTLKLVIGKRQLYSLYGNNFKIANENNKTESIFEIQYGISPYNSDLIAYLAPRQLTGVGFTYGILIPSSDALTKFDVLDQRTTFTFWNKTSTITFDGTYICKYNDPLLPGVQIADAGSLNLPVIRYSHVLMLYAEALNASSNGPTKEAYDAVNAVRARSGLGVLNNGLSQDQFVDALLDEGLREFMCEGSRWFDLKRTNKLAKYLTKYGFKTGTNEVFPIPQAELDANKNMTQNPGY